jgi:SLOG-like protein
MITTRLSISLEQYEIGLSGAVPDRDDWSEPAMDRGILEFVSLFSGIVLKYGGRIVHGSHPTFTPVILRQARLQAPKRARKPVTLVMSDLWAAELRAQDVESLTDVAELVVTKKIGAGTAADVGTRNGSLTAMRRVLIDAQNVMVAVGGKMHDKDGMIPGVGEEMKLAAAKGIPRFLVAGLGGFARKLARQLTPSSLQNALSHAVNVKLFGSNDVASTVNILFEHLATSTELSQSAMQPIKWNAGLKAIIDHRDGTVIKESTGYIVRSIAA